jgi:hypothetical protein
MSFAFVGITLNIRNNKTYPIRINVLGSPFNPLDTANAKTEYRWDITAFIPSNDDTITLEYKPVGAAVFSTFTYQIYNTNIQGIISALDALGIGYFQSYTELGQLYLSTYNDNTEFGLLTITNNGAPATSTTTSTTTAAPTTSTTTTTTTGAPVQFFLGYNVAGGDSACSTGAGIYYAAAGTTTLQNGTIIYTDTFVPLTVPAPVGYYSDGLNWWYVSGVVAGELTSETLCFSGTSTTTTTTTAAPTTTTTSTTTAAPTTSTTTSTTTAAPTTSTTTTSTTAAPTTTTTTTTTAAPTTTTTTSTTTAANFSNTIGFGGAPEDACGFLASGSVTGDAPLFCDCTTFTGAIFAAASTGTWYVSFGGNVVSVSVINGNPVATVTSSCIACSSITSTTTTTTTAAPTTTTTTTTTTAAPTTSTSTTTTTALACVTSVTFDVDIAGSVSYTDCCGVVNNISFGIGPQVINDCLQNGSLVGTTASISSVTYNSTGCSCTSTTTTTTTAAPTTSTTTTSTTAAPTTTSTTTTSTTAAVGGFTISNPSGSGQIDDVTTTGGASFYVINSGSFPVTTGASVVAGLASLTGDPVIVDISSYTTNSCLSLYINGIFNESVTVTASGTYTFTNKTFSTSDTVLLEYVSGICI